MRAQQKGGKMKTRIVDSEITLILYYRNDAVSLPWYQDPDVVKQVDDRDTPTMWTCCTACMTTSAQTGSAITLNITAH